MQFLKVPVGLSTARMLGLMFQIDLAIGNTHQHNPTPQNLNMYCFLKFDSQIGLFSIFVELRARSFLKYCLHIVSIYRFHFVLMGVGSPSALPERGGLVFAVCGTI